MLRTRSIRATRARSTHDAHPVGVAIALATTGGTEADHMGALVPWPVRPMTTTNGSFEATGEAATRNRSTESRGDN